jgi:sterol desaturase/sphingolipid hydroxylase (fatty acid hydroxylase superfamily)
VLQKNFPVNPILYAIPIFMLTVAFEAFWVWRRHGNRTVDVGGRTRPIYQFADAMGSLQIGVLSRIAAAFPRLLTVGIYVLVYQQFAVMSWDKSNPLAWLFAVLLYDFFYYWKHRANHEVRIMWAGHITHHNSEYFNLSTALRQSSTTFIFDWMFYLPMAVVGVPPEMWIAAALIDLLYQYWTHTEIIGRLGWFDRVFVSPSNHRVHHGQNDYCIDRNYGGILIIWDRLFGTFEDERPEPIVYGVRTPLASVDPLWSNLHYYALIWRDFRAARGIDAKLDAIFAPPSGWRDEKLGHFEPLKFKRYEIKVARSLARYVTVQYAISVLSLCAFLYRFPHWTATQGMLAGAWIVAGLVALAAMMAGKRWGTTLEVGRWIAVIPLVWMLVG